MTDHVLSESEEINLHREKYGYYCRYCGSGEYDSEEARDEHERRCPTNYSEFYRRQDRMPF